MAAKSADEKR